MIIALKKDGSAMPNTEKYNIILSNKVSLFNAERTPKKSPKDNPKIIARIASKKVFGKVDFIIDETFKLDLTNEVLRYGFFRTIIELLKSIIFWAEYFWSSKKVKEFGFLLWMEINDKSFK